VPHLTYVDSMSFPSGHAMMAAVIYLTCAIMIASADESRIRRAFLISAAGLLTIIIGLSRLYMGVHYPSDVIGGWLIGGVWAVLCWIVWGKKSNGGVRG
jgi:undecaprenyl-diphosphatase